MNRAIFLDRDGTINDTLNPSGFVNSPEELILIPGASVAIQTLKEAGFMVVVITNQSGVARGYFTLKTLAKINDRMRELLLKEGTDVDGTYACPHHPDDNCFCRKPKPGLIYGAAKKFDIDIGSSFVVGDMRSDIQLAKNVSCRSVLVLTGQGATMGNLALADGPMPDFIAQDIAEAAIWIKEA